MKRFFFFSLSVAILSLSGLGSFHLWNNYQIEKAKTIAAKEQEAKAKEQKAELDAYYRLEFETNYLFILDAARPLNDFIFGNERNDQAEENMLKDGYNRAEIEKIRMDARKETANRLIQEEKKLKTF